MERNIAYGGTFETQQNDPSKYSSTKLDYSANDPDISGVETRAKLYPETVQPYEKNIPVVIKPTTIENSKIPQERVPEDYKPVKMVVEYQTIILSSVPLNTPSG